MSIKRNQVIAALVVGFAATFAAGSFATPFGVVQTGVSYAAGPNNYSYGSVRILPGAQRTPFGVARTGSAYAAPNPPLGASGYRYGVVKYGANAVKTPWGVMSRGCRQMPWGIAC